MTTLIPNTQAGVESYEDMFKEITRKLYGEETSHGLHTLGTPVAHIASGTTIPDGDRSFTTLVRLYLTHPCKFPSQKRFFFSLVIR